MDRLPEQQSSTSTVTDNVPRRVPWKRQFGGRFVMQDRLLLQPAPIPSQFQRAARQPACRMSVSARNFGGRGRDRTDEGPGGDCHKPAMNDNVLYHSLLGVDY